MGVLSELLGGRGVENGQWRKTLRDAALFAATTAVAGFQSGMTWEQVLTVTVTGVAGYFGWRTARTSDDA